MEHLAVFLHRGFSLDRWSVVTTYKVRLLSSDEENDRVSTIEDHVFKIPSKSAGYGWRKFIAVDKLRSGSFIEDDTIKFRVHLSTKNLERFVDF